LPSIKIPSRYKAGLAVLAALSEDGFNEVIASLNATPFPPKGQKELAVWVSSKALGVSLNDLQRLIETMASLYRLRIKSEVKPEVLAKDVAEAASKDAAITINGPADILEERLKRLLTVESFNLVDAKAKELQLEAEHTFCDARIVTDLRPVFGSNVSDSPEAMIIVQTLKLGYHDSGSQTHKEMYVALDSDDVAKLVEILRRAEEKAKTLKGKMDLAGIRLIDLT
jgi:hypothetical protein